MCAGKILVGFKAEGRPKGFKDAFKGMIAVVNNSIDFTWNVSHVEAIAELKLYKVD